MTDSEITEIMPFEPPVPDGTSPSDWFAPNSFVAPQSLNYDQFAALGKWIQTTSAGSDWWLGDWATIGDELFGDDFYAAVDGELFDRSYFAQCALTSQAFPAHLRHSRVSWGHHAIIAAKVKGDDAKRAEWLEEAFRCLQSKGELASAIKKAQAIETGSIDDDDLGKPQGDTEKVYPKDPPVYATVRMSFRVDAKNESIAESMKDSLAATVRVGLEDAGCDVSKTETAVSH